MVQIGVLGFGNVGQGVQDILIANADRIRTRCGQPIRIKRAFVRDLSKVRSAESTGIMFTSSADDILNDPEISIIVEVMGGEEPAFTLISQALRAKKHVVTANKEVIAKHKETLFDIARQNNVSLCFEAAVGGGIPIIRSLKIGLAPNPIEGIYGILNGTTNFILTRIEQDKQEFEEALKKAQDLGFAEANPHMDVSGLDTAYKLVILAYVGFKVSITLDQVDYEGITSITKTDIESANQLGYTIKLLAIGIRKDDGQCVFKVHPTLIAKSHPLAGVHNELNAVYVRAKGLGECLFSGPGAGPLPTGSAVVSDVIDTVLDFGHISLRHVETPAEKIAPLKSHTTESQFFIRLTVADTVGVLETVTRLLGKHNISIADLIQKKETKETATLLIITHHILESEMKASISELEKESVLKVESLIRVGI